MKKYLFSHRRSHRQPRSVLDWVLHSDSSKSQETDSDDEPEQSKSDNHRGGRMRAMGITGTTIDLARVKEGVDIFQKKTVFCSESPFFD